MYSININDLKNSNNKKSFISSYIKNNSLYIELIYDSSFENAKVLRDLVDTIGKIFNISKKESSRLVLIVDELNNNAIEYGTEEGGENKIRINIIKNENIDITIEVEDSGKGIKAKNALEMETLRAHQLKLGYGNHSSIRGRGLFMIIFKSVDRLYFKDSKNNGLIVGIKKKI